MAAGSAGGAAGFAGPSFVAELKRDAMPASYPVGAHVRCTGRMRT
ncbi:hypothetical protein BSIN_2041 [Burkholderia singularis]|uniref:Uncharacterized protein n=1 Tax=Burkholderia singularis TaxID=1503053 RepID=A0A238H0I8_9BURK|nr:hypothetical protein BSIN_2041 [Burkholderia singularis]